MPAISAAEVQKKKQELQRLQAIEREQMNALTTKSSTSKKKKTLSQKSSAKTTTKTPVSLRKSPRSDASASNLPKNHGKKKTDSKVAARRTKSKDKTLKEAQQVYPSTTEDLIGLDNGEEEYSEFYGKENQFMSDNSLIDFADAFNSSGDLVNLQDDVIYEEDEHKANGKLDDFQFQDQQYNNNNNNKKGLMQSDDEFSENESESELFREEQPFQEQLNGDNAENTDREENVWEKEEIREKIFREMQEEKLRELELQEKQYNSNNSNSVGLPPKSQNKIDELEGGEEFIVRRKISGDYHDDEEEFSDDSVYMDNNLYSPTERIRIELEEQDQRERELNHVHRTLSQENLFYEYHSPVPHETEDEETGDEDGVDDQDTRTKIFQEMETLKERENELRKKRFYYSQQSLNEIEHHEDHQEENEEVEEVKEEDQQVSVIDKIKQEMYDLQNREEELQRQRPRYNSFESMRTDGSTELNDNLGLSSQPIFGSRDDLVAFFGTAEDTKEVAKPAKKTPRSQHSVKIPKVFRKNVNISQKNENSSPSSKQEPRELAQYKLDVPKDKAPSRSATKEKRYQRTADKTNGRVDGKTSQETRQRTKENRNKNCSNEGQRTRNQQTNGKSDKAKTVSSSISC